MNAYISDFEKIIKATKTYNAPGNGAFIHSCHTHVRQHAMQPARPCRALRSIAAVVCMRARTLALPKLRRPRADVELCATVRGTERRVEQIQDQRRLDAADELQVVELRLQAALGRLLHRVVQLQDSKPAQVQPHVLGAGKVRWSVLKLSL